MNQIWTKNPLFTLVISYLIAATPDGPAPMIAILEIGL